MSQRAFRALLTTPRCFLLRLSLLILPLHAPCLPSRSLSPRRCLVARAGTNLAPLGPRVPHPTFGSLPHSTSNQHSSAKDQLTNTSVAIKKIMKPFSTPVLSKRTYRELKLLKHIRHENVSLTLHFRRRCFCSSRLLSDVLTRLSAACQIISLSDIFISPLEDIYFVTELLGTDLHRLLTSRPLDDQFIQYFVYQMLRGLKYVHSAGVIHRDLKPSNILVNENCDLKICDFGLARIQDAQMTGYVSTRYYRAPEIMLTWQQYDHAVDIWSVGCILAEMILGKPIFPGKDRAFPSFPSILLSFDPVA